MRDRRSHKSDLVGARLRLTSFGAPHNVFYFFRKRLFRFILSPFYEINSINMLIRYPLQSYNKKHLLKCLYTVEGGHKDFQRTPQRHLGEYGLTDGRTSRKHNTFVVMGIIIINAGSGACFYEE